MSFIFEICCLPLLVIGFVFVVGIKLINSTTGSSIPSFAGWITLKPFWTTPLLFLFAAQIDLRRAGAFPTHQIIIALSLLALPDIVSTLLIVWSHRDMFEEKRPAMIISMLVLDTMHWGNILSTIIMTMIAWEINMLQTLAAIGMPSIIAMAAWSHMMNIHEEETKQLLD